MPTIKIHSKLLQQFPFWDQLSKEEQSKVEMRASILRYGAGQPVRSGNRDCLGLIYVASGILRAYLLSPDGKEITLYRVKEGDICLLAASCVLDSISFDTQVDAEEDTEFLLIPADVYAELMENNICVQRDTYKLATERFSDVVAGFERLVFLTLEQRLTAFLLDEASEQNSDTIHMTHEQIATHIGSAREAVSRSLKRLASEGQVEMFRGGVHLKDKPALYAMFD